MADADVPITAGSGTKIDTRTVGAGTDEHRQVVVVGDPSTAANVQAVSAAGAAKVDGSAVTQPVSLAAAVSIGAGAATIGTVLNVGDVDHDAVNTLKVVQMGGHASPSSTKPAAVSAAGDRVRQWLDLNGAMIIGPRKLPTYSALYKGATRPYQLTNTFTANTRKQYATIFHAASATKTVRIRRVQVEFMLQTTAASEVNIEFVRLTNATTPATGNPAITPAIADNADAAAEATCLALPTTAGTEGAIWSSRYLNLGVTGAASTASPPVYWDEYEMVNAGVGDDESKLPTIRAGVAEGWAVVIDSTGAGQTWARVTVQFTEEA